MAIRFKPRETIEIKPIDLQPKKALGIRLPFASFGNPFILNYTTKDQVKSNINYVTFNLVFSSII